MCSLVSYKLIISILRQFSLYLENVPTQLVYLKTFTSLSSKFHLSVRFHFNRWFRLYSYVVIPYVSMSGQSGSGRERHRGRTDYLSGYQKREKKQNKKSKKRRNKLKQADSINFYSHVTFSQRARLVISQQILVWVLSVPFCFIPYK